MKLTECQYFIQLLIAKEFDNQIEIAATGLAFTFLWCTTCWFVGLCQPVETLTAHAYSTGDTRICTLYLFRAILIGGVAYLPMLLIEHFSDRILISLG